MTEPTDRGAFPELFDVIQGYAHRDYNHQVKALRTIAAVYLPQFEVPPMPDAKQVVEDILRRNEFLLSNPQTGQPPGRSSTKQPDLLFHALVTETATGRLELVKA